MIARRPMAHPVAYVGSVPALSANRPRTREELFLVGVLAIAGLVDWFHLIRFASISVLALLTGVYAFLSWVLWIGQGSKRRHIASTVRPFLIFVLWILSSFIWFPPNQDGIQNFLVLAAFVGITLLGENATFCVRDTGWLIRNLVRATALACVLYTVFLLLGGLGSNLVFHARTFATFVLIGMAWFLACWRYGSKHGLAAALVIVFLIILSLSRMALTTACLLFPLAWLGQSNWRRQLRLFATALVILVLLYTAVSHFEPLRKRFALDADVASLNGDEAAEYTSGRFTYWVVTLASSLESPWIGHGAGSSATLISSMFPVDSPLDEPLRLLHDYGAVGLALFFYAAWRLVRKTWKFWREAERRRLATSRLHLAAFLAVVGVFFPMITENSLMYLFIMAPLGVFLGATLGLARATGLEAGQ